MERAADDDKMGDALGEAFANLPPWLAFERNIFVKHNAPEILSRTLRYGSDRHLALLEGESIVIGTATDPYQPAERRFKITRRILEALVKRVAGAGATYVGACALRLQSAARKRYLPFIEQEFPHLAERYRNTYARGYQAGDKYRDGLSAFFNKLCRKYGLPSSSKIEDDEGDESPDDRAVPSEQLPLAI